MTGTQEQYAYMTLSVSEEYCGAHIAIMVKSASRGRLNRMYGLYLPHLVRRFSMACPMSGTRNILMSEPPM